MAAVRRSSGSGVVVALVVFVILAVAGIGSAIYFYQRYAQASQALATTQTAIKDSIHEVFRDSGWTLTTQEASPLGVEYVRQSFKDVAGKLELAAEYEDLQENELGWESVAGMKDAIRTAPVQREAEETGTPPMTSLKGLLALYERLYEQATSQVESLRSQNQQLTQQRSEGQDAKAELEEQLRTKVNTVTQSYNDKLAALQKSYDELDAELDRRSQQASERQEDYQEQINQAKSKVAELQDELEQWKERYEEIVRGPEKREKLQPDGQVIRMDTEQDFVYIEGGEDKGFRENERYVVFERMPSGEDRRKGVIVLAHVGDIISRGTLVSEEQYVLEGDYFVAQAKWNEFHGG